jgi:hypothetical protein
MVDFGHYKECLETKFHGTPTRFTVFQIYFPFVDFEEWRAPVNNTTDWVTAFKNLIGRTTHFGHFLFAFCLPSQCKESDITQVMESTMVKSLTNPLNISLHSSQTDAEDPYEKYNGVNRMAYAAILVVIAINIIATIVSRYQSRKNKVLQCFDIAENHNKITGPAREVDDERLYFYTSFKAFFIILGVLIHHAMPPHLCLVLMKSSVFSYYRKNGIGKMIFCPLNFMSGVITSSLGYVALRPLLGKIPISTIVTARLFRTVPVIFSFILLVLAVPVAYPIIPRTMKGPLFDYTWMNVTEGCLKNGWKELLMMGDYVQNRESCVPAVWYVATDFKIAILSLPLMFALKKSLSLGVTFAVSQVLWGSIAQYIYLGTTPRPYGLIASNQNMRFDEAFTDKHSNPIQYISVYAIGITWAHLTLYHSKRRYGSGLLAFICFLLTCISKAYLLNMYDEDGVPLVSDSFERFYVVFDNVITTFLMTVAYDQLMNMDWMISLGKSQLCSILSRISFTSFVFTTIFNVYFLSRHDSPPEYDMIHVFGDLIYAFTQSVVWGYFMSLFFEFPIINLLKVVMGDKKDKVKTKGDSALESKKES